MKISRIKDNEIDSLFDFLNDIEDLYDNLKRLSFEDIDFNEYDSFNNVETINELLTKITRLISTLPFKKALFNLTTLLENTADLNSDTLDFNDELKMALKKYRNGE